jgi:sulfite reductase (NADPH) hemoprotein beta-component
VEKRTGFEFEENKPFQFNERSDVYGWSKNASGNCDYTLFVENGRVLDEGELKLKSALLEIAKTGQVSFRFTVNQNLIITDVHPKDKSEINKILEKYKIIEHTDKTSAIRKNSIACVALPTCPLALAESQRYLPSLIRKIEALLKKHNLQNENIITRMTGCPNGCGRSPAAEIGFIGTALEKYNLHLGGDHEGYRLNQLFKESLGEEEILWELDKVFGEFKNQRRENESFGDFTYRTKFSN